MPPRQLRDRVLLLVSRDGLDDGGEVASRDDVARLDVAVSRRKN